MLPARIPHDLPRVVDRKGAAGYISRQRTEFAHSLFSIPHKSPDILPSVGIADHSTRVIDSKSFAVISSLEGTEITHASGRTPKKRARVASVYQARATHDSSPGAVHVPSYAAPILPQSSELDHRVTVGSCRRTAERARNG